MSRKKTYPIPDVNKTFFYGNVVSGRSMGDVVYLKSRKNYSFRLFLNAAAIPTRYLPGRKGMRHLCRFPKEPLFHFLIPSENFMITGCITI